MTVTDRRVGVDEIAMFFSWNSPDAGVV